MASEKRKTHLDLSSITAAQDRSPVPASDRATDPKPHIGDRSAPMSHVAKTLKRKDASPETDTNCIKRGKVVSSDKDAVYTGTGLKELQVVKAAKAGTSVLKYVKAKHECPWESLQKIYKLQLDGFVTVATRAAPSHELVTVRSLSSPDAAAKVDMLQRIHHKNFIAFLDCFVFNDCHYIILEHATISLAHIVKSPAYPTERQLAAILGQILDGLTYLVARGLEHGSLSCSNVLLSTQGDVKITGQQCCREINSSSPANPRDVRALGYIVMELMQKYVKDDGAVGVEDLNRWPSDSNAVGFLSMTTSAASVNGLRKHPLLNCPWQKEELAWIVEITEDSVFRAWTYLQ